MIELYNLRGEVREELINTVAELLAAKCRGTSVCPCIPYADCPLGNVDCSATRAEDWIQYFESRGD